MKIYKTHWLAAKMTNPPRTWPNFGTIPAPVPNPYTRIEPAAVGTRAEAVHRAVEVLKAKS